MDSKLQAQIEALINYYIVHQATGWLTYVPLFAAGSALITSLFAIFLSTRQLKTAFRNHARVEWNGLLDACIKDSDFVDASYTSNYHSRKRDQYYKYQAFCYRAWSRADFLVRNKMHKEKLYETMITWITAFHREWLEKNPYLFSSHRFWSVYKQMRRKPLMVFQNRGLPRKEKLDGTDADKIDWNEVSKDYHERVLGPWSPEMMSEVDGKPCKNFLLNAFDKYTEEQRQNLKILDCGCGPGNILEHLNVKIPEIFGLDTSQGALDIAAQKAEKVSIAFIPLKKDMRTYNSPTKFDVIISTNSILPENKEDIRKILSALHNNLKSDGRLLLILPAFDACLALVGYWKEHLENSLRGRFKRKLTKEDQDFLQRCIKSFEAAKKLDRNNRRYADDGENPQCFHTEASIKDDLKATGFELVEMKKIHYPWDYAAKFDYGYFPDKEEIWDWYVEASKAATNLIPPP